MDIFKKCTATCIVSREMDFVVLEKLKFSDSFFFLWFSLVLMYVTVRLHWWYLFVLNQVTEVE